MKVQELIDRLQKLSETDRQRTVTFIGNDDDELKYHAQVVATPTDTYLGCIDEGFIFVLANMRR